MYHIWYECTHPPHLSRFDKSWWLYSKSTAIHFVGGNLVVLTYCFIRHKSTAKSLCSINISMSADSPWAINIVNNALTLTLEQSYLITNRLYQTWNQIRQHMHRCGNFHQITWTKMIKHLMNSINEGLYYRQSLLCMIFFSFINRSFDSKGKHQNEWKRKTDVRHNRCSYDKRVVDINALEKTYFSAMLSCCGMHFTAYDTLC